MVGFSALDDVKGGIDMLFINTLPRDTFLWMWSSEAALETNSFRDHHLQHGTLKGQSLFGLCRPSHSLSSQIGALGILRSS
mmetsp:Transcript_33495/g.52094  ORF Transcript_33495/g.52094 Transcript_33495/m.52094 type:complete len:81 (-) Transcript_33495:235-477(-)